MDATTDIENGIIDLEEIAQFKASYHLNWRFRLRKCLCIDAIVSTIRERIIVTVIPDGGIS